MRAPQKPLPIVDQDTQPFWEGCANGQLLLQRCGQCGALRHPPSPFCHECLSPANEWVAASGEGTVYSYVVVHRPFHPAWDGETPYVVAIIALAEGPHIMSNVVGVPVDQVAVGMPVKVTFERATDEITLPKFGPL